MQVNYLSVSGATLQELLTGIPGDGWLRYYSSAQQKTGPVIAVHLIKPSEDSPAQADIYQVPGQPNYTRLETLQDVAEFNATNEPLIIIRALDGWWQKDGLPNYNLDIQIKGPMYAMWGAGYDPVSGPQGWAAEITPGELAVEIQVRDTDQDGLPDWELRRLVPEFRGSGYLRTNYTERKCITPTIMDQGAFPDWPYISSSGGYEQKQGIFRPPVVVDWTTGIITHFSELVTARNQNCTYTIYSLNLLENNQLNQLDFETPFTFYDLSGKGSGYPNLILRTERYSESSIWLPEGVEPFESIRYSWRNEVGDWLWDYKVDVLGLFPYDSQILIADGQYLIDAPGYEEFPRWVMDRSWPLVTFIDTEGNSYRSSEGIYDWSSRGFGVPYFTGQVDYPNLEYFQTIRQGLRGEYRIEEGAQVVLYYSPLDGRLHLYGAQGGMFNLGDDLRLRSENLNDDAYLDAWFFEEITPETETTPASTQLLQALFDLNGMYLYAGEGGLSLVSTSLPKAAFEILPPVDHESWSSFREIMVAYEAQRKDPHELGAWLEGLGQVQSRINGMRVIDYYTIDGELHLEIELLPGFSQQGEDLAGIEGLNPGRYLLIYDHGAIRVEPLRPAQFSLKLTAQSDDQDVDRKLYRLSLTAINQGNQSSDPLEAVLLAECGKITLELFRENINVPEEGRVEWTEVWQPPAAQDCHLSATLTGTQEELVAQAVLDVPASLSSGRITLSVLHRSTNDYLALPTFLFLGIIGGITGFSFWFYQRSKRVEKEN